MVATTNRIIWDASHFEHTARVASWRPLDGITRSDRETYVSLYTPNGVIHDPVGRTSVDPTGMGHRGHDPLATFWDQSVASITGGMSLVVHKSLATDNQVANSFTIIIRPPHGGEVATECICVYRVDADGLLLYVGAHWEVPGSIRPSQ
jgi:steroid Delta-isomerase